LGIVEAERRHASHASLAFSCERRAPIRSSDPCGTRGCAIFTTPTLLSVMPTNGGDFLVAEAVEQQQRRGAIDVLELRDLAILPLHTWVASIRRCRREQALGSLCGLPASRRRCEAAHRRAQPCLPRPGAADGGCVTVPA
jgi:hypothetical protein